MNATPAFAVPDQLSYLLARASHVVASKFNHKVRAAGLTVLEWRVLATLLAGEQHSVGSLADRVLAQQPTVTKVLDRMERLGRIERIAADGDRRRSTVRITNEGRAIIADLLESAREHEQASFAPLDEAEARILKSALRKLVERTGSAGLPEPIDAGKVILNLPMPNGRGF